MRENRMKRASGIRTRRELLRCTGGALLGYLGGQYLLAREKLAMAKTAVDHLSGWGTDDAKSL